MKRFVVLCVALLLILAGCSSSAGKDGNKPEGEKGKKTELEVMMFEGGFGSEWVKQSAEDYMALNKDVTIKVTASPDIHQQLQTNFLSGDVPDLMNPGPSFDIMGVIGDDQILALDEHLDGKAHSGDEKWLDTFEAAQFNLKKDGKTYGLPTIFSPGYVWWYDEKLFEDNGWELPKTWDDLYELEEKAKEKDIAVFALQGKNVGYYFFGIYLPLVQKIGGTDAILDAFNLKEGAWDSEPFLKAAEESVKMVNEDLYLKGTMALSHTEAQTLFFQRKALFVTAGSWLEGEMKDIIPEDFKLRAINQPAWKDKKDEQDYAPIATGWGGGWYIPKASKNHEETVKFLKFLSSKEEVTKMVKTRGLASVVKGTDEAIESDALKSTLAIVQNASGSYAPTAINDAYPELTLNIQNMYQSLMLGESTPEEFVKYAEQKAKEVREDDSIEKVEFQWNK